MPGPPDLQGASRTTGGTIRGKALGNVFNIGDSEDALDIGLVSVGRVKFFKLKDNPSTANPSMSLKVKIGGDMASMLGQISKRYSPIESEFFIMLFSMPYNYFL